MHLTITTLQKDKSFPVMGGNMPVGMQLTLGDNPVLAEIVAATFDWEAIHINVTVGIKTINIPACRKGKNIVMLPHFSYGASLDKEMALTIMQWLKEQTYACEWRSTQQFSTWSYSEKVSSILNLTASQEQEFDKLSSSVRHKIRKSASNGITVVKGKEELLHSFYKLYARRMHQLGSPALPLRWFRNLLKQYKHGEASIWCAYKDNELVGTAFMLEFHGFYEACWVATHVDYNKYYTSYALYWQMIQYAVEQCGIRFSFGRSTAGGSVHHFKQQWGTIDLPLYWNYTHPRKNNLRKSTFLRQIWKLIPCPVAKMISSWFGAWVY